jgi:ABC-type multidrug transport system ATPase subunit
LQIDALYNELTVRESLIFSGKFQLPFGTPLEEIEDLADAVMAAFDLSRVMHADVGRPHEGGLSKFERKGLSIAVELMRRPRILFLESPTGGLNPSAALRIIRDLKKFVDIQGITLCASISEARRDVFELFDSVLLLGSCSKVVYHGQVGKIGKYFNQLNYILPDGESVTDWLLDIATGRLPPPVKQYRQAKTSNPASSGDTMPETESGDEMSTDEKRKNRKVTFAKAAGRTPASSDERDNLTGSKTKPFDIVSEQAKATCELLHDNWTKHVKELSKKKRAKYQPPSAFGLPRSKERPPFVDQLFHHLRRLLILTERNWLARFIDTTIVVVIVILVTAMDGAAEPTREVDMHGLNYERLSDPSRVESLLLEFPTLFSYAISGIERDIEKVSDYCRYSFRTLQLVMTLSHPVIILLLLKYATAVGVSFAIVVSVLATKLFRSKRQQFFREAASGYNVGAFFLARIIMGTLEHAFQAVLSALFAYSIRNSLSAWYSYVIHFLLLSWVSASWGIFLSLVMPRKHVNFVVGFLVAFFALMFCGAIPPIDFEGSYLSHTAHLASLSLSVRLKHLRLPPFFLFVCHSDIQ